ncbi:hypothetical protein Mucpa_0688 [Mucilaginibacter paludis DSM 18603]|uniref:Uncharacterized protein n=1 Tax=Mucilaginibacter paludis DSM 18603 TaxID=714943 RepID=H1Y6C2_9SPHI|nr:hypothetical protein Mucpa_0688 [Mucilaginibacter paludis DSM 18603]
MEAVIVEWDGACYAPSEYPIKFNWKIDDQLILNCIQIPEKS